MGYYDQDNLPETISTLIERKMINNKIEDVRPKQAILQHKEGIDLIPANLNLSLTEVKMFNAMCRECLMRDCLEELKKDYDYILIDCMPSLGMLTTNALAMANEVIIPVQSQYLSAKGMGNLLQTISLVKRNLNKDLKVGGILLTLVDTRTNLPRKIQQELEENYGSIVKLYDSQIPVAIKTAESTSKGKSIFAYDKNSKVAEAYSFFAKEVLKEDERERRKNALAKGYDR